MPLRKTGAAKSFKSASRFLATPLNASLMPSPETSRQNLEKAKANWRKPRPWRSNQETRVIKRIVWQWFTNRGPGKWPGRALARRLGGSHTYVQKLIREFRANPREPWLACDEATFRNLSEARAITRQERARGHLRGDERAEFNLSEAGSLLPYPDAVTQKLMECGAMRDQYGRPADINDLIVARKRVVMSLQREG